MSYKLRNNLFTVILFLILAFVIFFAIWKFAYGSLACQPISNASEAYGIEYNDLIHTYQGTVNGKFDVSFLEPTLLEFNSVAKVGEKPSSFYKGSGTPQIVLTLSVAPKIGGSFKYTVQLDEIVSISAATRTDKGYVVIDHDTLEIVEDATSGININDYSKRIENLVTVADTVWGDSIVAK